MERIRFTKLQGHFFSARARIYSSGVAAFVAAFILISPVFAAPAVSLTFSQASRDLKSSDLSRRYAAAQGMKNFGPQGAVAVLTANIASEKNSEVQAAMLDSLLSLHDITVIPAIAPLLSSPSAFVRERAAHSIGLLGGPQAESVLAAALPRETDLHTRTTELQGLSLCGSARSVGVIQTQLEDSKPQVRAQAIAALRRIPGQESLRALKAHKESDSKLRQRQQEAINARTHGAS